MATGRLEALVAHLHVSPSAAAETLAASPECASSEFAGPTVGLLVHDAGKACPGLTMFCKGRSTFLLGNDGEVVHEWKSNRPGSVAYLQDNGNLIRYCQAPRFNGADIPRDETRWNQTVWSFAGGSGFIQELGWDSQLIWEYPYASHDHLSHHDIEVLPNGNILLVRKR